MTEKTPYLEEEVVSQVGSKTKKQLALGILISVTTVLLILGVTELIAYFWENKTAQGPFGWTLVASRRMDLVGRGSADQPYYLYQPGKDYLWEGIPVHIDSHGLRSDEFENPKPTNTYRILNLGDSTVFGWEVNQSDTFGKQLERKLNDHNDGRTYEVINAGIPTWNLELERNFLLQEGLNYMPDLVILNVTVVNDIGASGSPITEDMSFFQWLRDNTYSWPFLSIQAHFLMAGQTGPEAIPVLNPPQDSEEYFPTSEDDPAYEATWKYIADMQTALENRGIDLIVVIFPTAFQINGVGHPDTPQRSLRSWAEVSNVLFLDMLPIYRQVYEQAKPGDFEGYENLLFTDVWMHPNPFGHQLAAEALEEMIIGTLPE